MASTTTLNPSNITDPAPAKKGKSKKAALKDKKQSTNEVNILAGKLSDQSQSPLPMMGSDPEKENHESLQSGKKKSKAKKSKVVVNSFENDLKEMQDMLEKMKIEKDEILKEKDEILKEKDEILKKKDEELKKLRKMKEFKPIMNLQSFKDKEVEKEGKKKKDSSERKRPASAYALWCKDQWTEMKKENPAANFNEVSRLIAAKWKSLSAEEKKPYEEKYQADNEAYLKIIRQEKREIEAMKLLEEEQKQKTAMELLDQYLQYKQEADKGSKKTMKEKDPSKPKQPVSAFLLYSNERQAVLLKEGKKLLESSKMIGEEWKKMKDEEKLPYEEIAKANKEKYQKEMEIYEQKKAEEAAKMKQEEGEMMKLQKAEALQLFKKKEKVDNIIKKTKEDMKKKKQNNEKNADPNKPKRPATSFLLFSKEERKNIHQERPDVNASVINSLISMKWKELKEEEKKIWNEKAAEGMKAYKKEMEEYNKQVEAKDKSSC